MRPFRSPFQRHHLSLAIPTVAVRRNFALLLSLRWRTDDVFDDPILLQCIGPDWHFFGTISRGTMSAMAPLLEGKAEAGGGRVTVAIAE
jgi:hypothetical protein